MYNIGVNIKAKTFINIMKNMNYFKNKKNILIGAAIAMSFALVPSFVNAQYSYDSYTPSYSYDSYTPDYTYYTYPDYSYSDYSYPDYSNYSDYSYPDYSGSSYVTNYSCSDGSCTSSQSQAQSQSQDVVVNNTNVNNNNNEVVVIDNGNGGNNNNNNFDVNCEVSDTSVDEGDYVTFTANVSGGNSPFTYDWNGDINSNSQSVRARFNDGSYSASVTVRDNNGRTASDTCSTVRVSNNNSNLDVQCEISDTSVNDGDYVDVDVNIDGGNSPYDITWSGDTGDFYSFNRYDDSQRVRVDTNSDRINLKVTVEDDDGNEESDTCTINVGVNYSNYSNSYNDGQLSGLSSVFLSQVPYTGPEDILKTIGFIVGLLIWSAIIATVLLRKRNRKEVSSKATAFKEANKLKKFSN